jgi:hypothetical protein
LSPLSDALVGCGRSGGLACLRRAEAQSVDVRGAGA